MDSCYLTCFRSRCKPCKLNVSEQTNPPETTFRLFFAGCFNFSTEYLGMPVTVFQMSAKVVWNMQLLYCTKHINPGFYQTNYGSQGCEHVKATTKIKEATDHLSLTRVNLS